MKPCVRRQPVAKQPREPRKIKAAGADPEGAVGADADEQRAVRFRVAHPGRGRRIVLAFEHRDHVEVQIA